MRSCTYRGLLVTLAAAGVAHLGQAADYYVSPAGRDSNSGTLAAPFLTLLRASNVAGAGDTIFVRGGDYNMTSTMTIRANGAPGRPERIVAYPGETPRFFYAPTLPVMGAMVVVGNDAEISGLTIIGARSHGISIWGAQRITFRQMQVHGSWGAGFSTSYPTVGVNTHIRVLDSVFSFNCQSNGGPRKTSWPPAVYMATAVDSEVRNCVVAKSYGEGIGFNRSERSIAADNLVFDTFGVGIYLDASRGITVDNNMVFSSNDPAFYKDGWMLAGIQLALEPAAWAPIPLANNVIRNNIIVNTSHGIAYGSYGLGGGMQNTQIRGNIIVNAIRSAWRFDASPAHAGNVIERNMTVQLNFRPNNFESLRPGFTVDRNLWWGADPAPMRSPTDVMANPQFIGLGSTDRRAYEVTPWSPIRGLGIGPDSIATLSLRP